MQEKRRSKRLPIQLELVVSNLFQQETIVNLDSAAPITVVNVSKVGIGFVTSNDLPIGYYFNAKLELGNQKNTLYCVVRILRKTLQEDGMFYYGCEMVGLAPILGTIFDEYERMLTEEE